MPDVPDVPVPAELNDRAADSWEPLLALAAEAGGDWPGLARLAAIAPSGDEVLELSTGMRLLADIREVFGERDHLLTSDLLQALHEMDEAPWGRVAWQAADGSRISSASRTVQGDSAPSSCGRSQPPRVLRR